MDKGKMLWTILGFGIALSVVGAAAYFINTQAQPEEEEEEPVQPKGGIYLMMVEGVDGEAQDKDHVGWIILDSFTFPTIREPAPSGTTRRTGERTYEPVRIVKRIDKSSPKLMDACVKGTVIPKVMVKYCRMTEAGDLITLMVYEFKNVEINGFHGSGSGEVLPTEEYSTGGSGGEDTYVPKYQPFFDVGKTWKPNRMSEGISFNFEEIKVTYDEMDSENKSKGKVEFTWKVEEAEAL